ncbi:unnamed protein product [Paramecium pentaurelia]|uniref:VWFA domain-containing protein n=1 Tax=Paramecium pentaurelia TaxID=43138 RepID=A0A8S1TQW5_9CILI|nr:unnamed protein product [Paramecium pentaurelia]
MGNQKSLEEKVKSSMVQLHKMGFQLKQNESTISELKNYNPKKGQGTAVRDAILFGFTKILNAMIILKNCEQLDQYKFVHIVLTDGEDNSSSTSISNLSAILNKVKDICRTLIIGIDMKKEQLPYISKECEYYDVRSSEIESLFHRISVSLGLKVTTAVGAIVQNDVGVIAVSQKKELSLNLRRCKYMIMLTIDGSPSMNDGEGWWLWKTTRWSLARKAVKNLMKSLEDEDRICASIFDQNFRNITETGSLKLQFEKLFYKKL